MNPTSVDLNLLVALDALLTECNVTRAAARVGMTQPGMSNALGRLRRLFGDDLLVRSGRTFVLSPQGEALAGPVAEILAQIQHTLNNRMSFDPSQDERNFSISASDYATLVLIGPLVRRLSTEAPGVTVHVSPRVPEVAALLEADEVDFVIEPLEIMPVTVFPGQRLLGDRWLSAVWADNPEVGEEMTEDVFLALPHLIYAIGRGHKLALPDQFLHDRGVQRRIEFSVESFLLAPFLLRGTRFTTLVPERSRPALQSSADIRLLKPPLRIPDFTEFLWWHPRHTADPAHQWFRKQLGRVAAELERGAQVS